MHTTSKLLLCAAHYADKPDFFKQFHDIEHHHAPSSRRYCVVAGHRGAVRGSELIHL
jgi:hypothetical protein